MVQGIIVIRTLAGAWILLAAVGVRGSQGSANQPDPTRPVAVFVVDLASDGFQLVSADKGVTFDIDGAGAGARIGWTAPTSDDSFLFLDRNRNGVVDNGLELLGNGLRRSDGSRVASGDEALLYVQGLRVGDVPLGPVPPELEHAAFIDSKDEVFGRLKLWRDDNHNARSEPSELQSLVEAGVLKVHVGFRLLRRQVDPVGNVWLLQGAVYVQGRVTEVSPLGHESRRMVEIEFGRRP